MAASGQNNVTVTAPAGFAVSPPLSDIQDIKGKNPPNEHVHRLLPNHGKNNDQQGHDDALQTSAGPAVRRRPHANFAGVGANGDAPPDTNIAVGPRHIVETVNAQYAIYDHNGVLLLGPKTLGSLWSALGGACATNNAGDPGVQYDKLADRWLIAQMGSTSSPYSECIAVSQTNDPAGAYYLYSYAYDTLMNDYPKFGVWPTASNSAYLATYNLFSNGTSFTGGQLCAYDRAAMLSGATAPTSICSTIPNDGGFLPADLDGPTAPLDGTPAYFLNYETLSSLRMYTLSPNFANPGASVLTAVTPDLAVTGFSEACNGGTCIPQLGTTQKLDSLGDRLMYRLAFRVFADHEAIVVNHSVAAGSTVGVRWYELRAPLSPSGTFSVFQQGTFAPDSTYRWMGSAAMDQVGNIAVGYSASSSNIHPAIRYTGRAPGDPPGTMASEASLIEGTGSQTGGLARWGDYTSMRIDPLDDCTFWYSNEYLSTDGSFNWKTFIGSFKLAGCPSSTPSPDFSLSPSPSSFTLTQAQSGTSTINVASVNGFTGTVALSASAGCPAGSTCTFNPASVTAPGTSTLTVASSTATPPGVYAITVTGIGSIGSHSTSLNVTVQPPASDTRQGLIGYWNFDEGSGTIAHDSSGNGYNATVTGATWTAGKTNSALSFNGTTNNAVTGGIPLTNAFSVSAWVNPTVTTQGMYARIAETRYNGGLFLGTDAKGTKYKFFVNTGLGATGSCGAAYGCAQGGTVTSGWHLVTGTFDGTTAKLYVDNALVASETFTAPANTSYPLTIGRYYGANGYGWNGAIDEVRLYNRALTSMDVNSIYNSISGPPDIIPPTVSITAPSANSTLSSTVTVTASAGDNVAVADVQFQLDGANLGADLTAAPYTFSWDTTTATNGSHTLTAIARDSSNNSTTSSPVVLTVSNTVIGPPSTQGLIGYWNFDEGSGTIAHDSSGNGYNATVTGATWTTGKTNSGLSFNGTTNNAVTGGIPLTNAFSVSAWVSPTVTTQGMYVRIAETRYNGGLFLGTDAKGTKYKFFVNTGVGATGSCGAAYGCAQGGTVTSGWHLVTGTFDGTTAKLYVDNALVASETFTAPANASYPLTIGRYYGANGYGWNGAIDEVRLYNRALTATEVGSIYSH